jgi:L-threonylcarbamoyladenylate synthase
LVALPTETVYGLAGDASDPAVVERIFTVKGRPATHPVIVHLPGIELLDTWARDVPSWARRVAETFWPGPLTLITPKASTVHPAVTGGQATVGLRVPNHALTLEVLSGFGGGLAAPSANRYGHVSPTTAQHVLSELGGSLDAERDLVIDGGSCPVGVESTIIGAWDATPRLLRPGAITVEQVAEAAGHTVVTDTAGVRAPGTTASHYSPRATVIAVEVDDLDTAIRRAGDGLRVGLIAPAGTVSRHPDHVVVLAAPEDDAEYARLLYAALRRADDSGLDAVVAVLPRDAGVGRAVRDRLRRASNAGVHP